MPYDITPRRSDSDNRLLQKILAALSGYGASEAGLVVQQGALDKVLDSVTVWPADASVVNTNALAASQVLKSSPGKLLWVAGYNSKASAQFIQLHDATSLPANGAVPRFVMTVPASSNILIPVPASVGLDFDNGIVVANSSTAATLTIGSADCFFTALVI